MFPTLADFVLLSLATWRVSRMIAKEFGPWDVFHNWRLRAGAVKTVNGFWTAKSGWGKLWICPLCLSVWVAPILLAFCYISPWFWWAVLLLAVSGAASLVELLTERR